MMIYASFNLPFRFLDEGTYDPPYVWMKTKYTKSFEKSERIAGLEIEGSGGGNVDTTSDEHGIINHTKVLSLNEVTGSLREVAGTKSPSPNPPK
jgi:hypothetical protein